jgi:hypothetical protein
MGYGGRTSTINCGSPQKYTISILKDYDNKIWMEKGETMLNR